MRKEKTISSLLFILSFLVISNLTLSQNDPISIKNAKSKKIQRFDRQVKRIIKKHRKADHSLGYADYNKAINTVVKEVKQLENVKDVFWDQCSEKITIYPGFATIGVLYIENKTCIETCYHIQLGKLVYFKLLKYRLIYLYDKHQMIYKRKSDCPEFIEKEKEKCKR